MTYKFLPDISIADIAFEAAGSTLEKLFESCALAVTNTMVKDLKSVKQKKKVTISLEAASIELLLFNFLNELLFYKDAKQLLFSGYKIKINQVEPAKEKHAPKTGELFTLNAILLGEKLNMKKHELIVDVKAVTMHLFEVKHAKGKWRAMVVLDI